MTQPNEAVGGEPIAPELTPEDRLNAAFGDEIGAQDEEDQPEADEAPEDQLNADDLEDETDTEAAADDLPPIEAPISWDAEAKAVFASLPREAQEIVTKREAERERFVQQKSQEAARARQDVEQVALTQLAQIEQSYAQQFQQIAAQLSPQRPDPAMIQYDPAGFYAQQAAYEATVAQQQQLQQQAHDYAQQAQQREALAQQQEAQREHQLIVETFPEYLDPTNGPKLRQELSAVARELGYPLELIEQARAPDILAMRTAAQWKAKADKLDRLEARKMEKVRAAKGLPKVSTPGAQRAPGATRQAQYATDREAMRRGDRNAATRVLDSFFDTPR
jgi:hypothetical protein